MERYLLGMFGQFWQTLLCAFMAYGTATGYDRDQLFTAL